tara:strand:+ start:22 stop:480 length:459 start_codon:yes stop_codon:yes gene_type:complete
MFDFFKNKDNKKNKYDSSLTNIAALLIHAAKIDENYTEKEREIIKKAIIELNSTIAKKNELFDIKEIIDEVLTRAEEIEKNSNQILDFTKEVKNINEDVKIKIIEVLWNIIYSDNNPDVYENSLMRRLTGLLYLDSKIVGSIKEKVKKKFSE